MGCKDNVFGNKLEIKKHSYYTETLLQHFPDSIVCCVVQELAQFEEQADCALATVGPISKATAYQAWLGFYNSYKKLLGWSSERLVQHANMFSQTIGEHVICSRSTS